MPTIVMKAKALPVAMLSHRLNVRDSWKQADVEMQEILSPKEDYSKNLHQNEIYLKDAQISWTERIHS